MRAKWAAILLLALALMAPSPMWSQGYGKELDKDFQKVFSLTKEDGKYRWYGYPVDNFGVLTSYDPPANQPLTDSTRVCATWTCIDIKREQVPNGDAQISVNGFADVGMGAAVTLDEKHKRSVLFSLILPQLAKLVSINGKIDWSKELDSQVTIGKAYRRSVDRDKFQQFLQNTAKNQTLRNDFGAGRLTYVAADIIVENVTAKLTLKANTSVQAKATLDKAAQAFSSNSSAELGVTSDTNGTYAITIPFPVVLATQMRRQPGAQTLSKESTPGVIVDAAAPLANTQTLWK